MGRLIERIEAESWKYSCRKDSFVGYYVSSFLLLAIIGK